MWVNFKKNYINLTYFSIIQPVIDVSAIINSRNSLWIQKFILETNE